jgi:hypothetical protein
MSEEKKYPDYNINVGVATTIKSLIELTTYKFHPYGLGDFRKNIIDQVDEWQSRGLSWRGHDNLTHAWRTPWDTHRRYGELLSPIVSTVLALVNQYSPDCDWFCDGCWISDYTQYSGANRHNHDLNQLGWSFCYYIKVPDSGPGFTICDLVDNENHQLNVGEGDLLLFRSPLEHQVFPTLERRIIISGNIINSNVMNSLHHYVYDNPEFMQLENLDNFQNNEVDPDNWAIPAVTQKLGVYTSGGY